jgi:ribosomal 50S subunit-associated protein YjgA (DUF615 family)
VSRKTKVDMSAEAVTARLKRAWGLGDAERLSTMIRSAMSEIKPEKPTSAERHEEKKKQVPHARIHS